MANIYDLANELERGIRALPEYQTVVDNKAKIDADPEAKALFEEFSAFQESLYAKMQSGQMPSEEDRLAIQGMGVKVESNPILKAYVDAQQALSVYLADIEKIVFSPLRDLND